MKLSVLIITYNHEAYICQALDSVLMQEVDFEYEIVVGEDNSTDNTRIILLEYKKKYPDKIKLILHNINVGMHKNLELTFDACKGQYIAFLEGDDYWIAKDKLQKQLKVLESDSRLTECFHKVTTIYQDKSKSPHTFPTGLNKDFFVLKDMVSEFFVPTLSVVFRRSAINKFPSTLYQVANPDWLIHILCAQKGSIGFIDEVMGVYRVHNNGVWSGIGRLKVLENTIRSANIINNYLDYEFNTIIKTRVATWHLECFYILLFKKAKVLLALKHFRQFISTETISFVNKIKSGSIS